MGADSEVVLKQGLACDSGSKSANVSLQTERLDQLLKAAEVTSRRNYQAPSAQC